MSVTASAALLCLVLTVQDGDSLRVRCDNAPSDSPPISVRIHAIDAPEAGQAYGRRARQALREKVYRHVVALRCVDTDPYGRQVCQVLKPAPKGQPDEDVGLSMVQQGWAWWYRQYAKAQSPADRQRYEDAETSARASGAGLWVEGEQAMPPWRWRQMKRRGGA